MTVGTEIKKTKYFLQQLLISKKKKKQSSKCKLMATTKLVKIGWVTNSHTN